jgi:subtilisin family serine protease
VATGSAGRGRLRRPGPRSSTAVYSPGIRTSAAASLIDESVAKLHRDFSYLLCGEPEPDRFDPTDALKDESGHGTHVAAIIAGTAPAGPVQIACQEWMPRGGDADMVRWSTGTLGANRTPVRHRADGHALRRGPG